jgi:hypothetical protein
MKVTWGTYPNHLGHKETAGCFRCHDKKHKTADGDKISKDCDTCHTILAEDKENPAILRQMSGEEPEEAAPVADVAPAADAAPAATTTHVTPEPVAAKGG